MGVTPFTELHHPDMFNNFMVDAEEEIYGQYQGHKLCNGESPPYVIYVSHPGQQICGREENYELSGDGNDHAVNSVSQSLKYRSAYNAETGQQKADADRPKRGNADAHHRIRSFKPLQQNMRAELEYQKTDNHQGRGIGNA